ncbi:hypothetical protein Lal_00030945 [Lupinus albus]|nr:hypothetical protein Lal_00030945 [Lupinus albus]
MASGLVRIALECEKKAEQLQGSEITRRAPLEDLLGMEGIEGSGTCFNGCWCVTYVYWEWSWVRRS